MNNEFLKAFIRRIISSIIVLLLVVSLVFVITRVSPGSPTQKYISPKFSPQLIDEVNSSFQLDKPVTEQYLAFIKNIFEGDLGISYNYRRPVTDVILDYLPFTIIFSSISFVVQIFISFLLAIISIKNKNNFIDRFISKSTLIAYATPTFLVGVILIYIFSYQFDLLPSSGLTSLRYESQTMFNKLIDYSTHMILPIIAISFAGIAVYYKYLRDSLEGNLNSLFVLKLKADGYSNRKILIKHVIPNSLSPVIAAAGVDLGILLGGALLVETIFGLPGMGRLTINAVFSRDYPLILGCVIVAGMMIIITNLIADMIRIKLDKRLIKGMVS